MGRPVRQDVEAAGDAADGAAAGDAVCVVGVEGDEGVVHGEAVQLGEVDTEGGEVVVEGREDGVARAAGGQEVDGGDTAGAGPDEGAEGAVVQLEGVSCGKALGRLPAGYAMPRPLDRSDASSTTPSVAHSWMRWTLHSCSSIRRHVVCVSVSVLSPTRHTTNLAG